MARLAPTIVPVLVAATLLAGCMGGTTSGTTPSVGTTSPSSTQQADECPFVTASSTVAGFTMHGGQWGAQDGAICGKATGSVQSLVQDTGPFTDTMVEVSMTMVAGESGLTDANLEKGHAGAGVVLHFKDERNFNIVRYSPREQGWHLFTMIDGNRQKRDEGSVAGTTHPEYGTQVALRVVSEGGRVTAFDGLTKVIDYHLPAEASHEGNVGLFLRDAGMVAKFTGFKASAA